jgi:hypothetical protein
LPDDDLWQRYPWLAPLLHAACGWCTAAEPARLDEVGLETDARALVIRREETGWHVEEWLATAPARQPVRRGYHLTAWCSYVGTIEATYAADDLPWALPLPAGEVLRRLTVVVVPDCWLLVSLASEEPAAADRCAEP